MKNWILALAAILAASVLQTTIAEAGYRGRGDSCWQQRGWQRVNVCQQRHAQPQQHIFGQRFAGREETVTFFKKRPRTASCQQPSCTKKKSCCTTASTPVKQANTDKDIVKNIKTIAKGDGATATTTITNNTTQVNIVGGGASRRIAGSTSVTSRVDKWTSVSSCFAKLGLTQTTDFYLDNRRHVMITASGRVKIDAKNQLEAVKACKSAA